MLNKFRNYFTNFYISNFFVNVYCTKAIRSMKKRKTIRLWTSSYFLPYVLCSSPSSPRSWWLVLNFPRTKPINLLYKRLVDYQVGQHMTDWDKLISYFHVLLEFPLITYDIQKNQMIMRIVMTSKYAHTTYVLFDHELLTTIHTSRF